MSEVLFTDGGNFDRNNNSEFDPSDSNAEVYIGPYERSPLYGQFQNDKNAIIYHTIDNTYALEDFNDGHTITTTNTGFYFNFSDNINRVTLIGGVFNDILRGGSGSDLLEGGAGADKLFGGDGIDTASYVGSSSSVTVDLSFTGAQVDGDAAGDVLTGIENLVGSAFNDTLAGDVNANELIGGDGDDYMLGGAGADRLIGGAGADYMVGGVGSDRYFVDNISDFVAELAGEGTDTVESTIDYVLGENVERLVLAGDAISGTGNDLNNAIFGTAGDNFLIGGLGRDTLQGNAGNDYLDGGADIDTMKGGVGNDIYLVDIKGDTVVELAGEGTDTVLASVSYSLTANVENLTLTGTDNIAGTGNALDNVIVGNDGNNVLSGGAGTNTLSGGLGNDTYTITSATDVIIENAGEGTDTVRSSVSYTVSDNIEKIVLSGTADINAIGNSTTNTIYGNAGDNEITGAGGRDVLYGRDGADTFVFKAITDSTVSSSGRDVIKDFSIAQGDKIDLSGIDLGEGSTFTFIGNEGFTKAAGEVNFKFSGENTIVQADTDGNGKADFSVFLVGHQELTADQFVLDHGTLIV